MVLIRKCLMISMVMWVVAAQAWLEEVNNHLDALGQEIRFARQELTFMYYVQFCQQVLSRKNQDDMKEFDEPCRRIFECYVHKMRKDLGEYDKNPLESRKDS